MIDKILIILPSRGRPEKINHSITSFLSTNSGLADLLVCLDDDDPELNNYTRHNGVFYDTDTNIRMCPTVNRAIDKYPDYKYYGFIGDDHVFRTPGWDKRIIDTIEQQGNGWGIVYGDDLLQHERLATACVMSANIIKALGHMCLPGLIHLYLDNYWMELGRGIGKLFYLPDVVIEHVHPGAGKAAMDARYMSVNSPDVTSHDHQVFIQWLEQQASSDIHTVKELMCPSIPLPA